MSTFVSWTEGIIATAIGAMFILTLPIFNRSTEPETQDVEGKRPPFSALTTEEVMQLQMACTSLGLRPYTFTDKEETLVVSCYRPL